MAFYIAVIVAPNSICSMVDYWKYQQQVPLVSATGHKLVHIPLCLAIPLVTAHASSLGAESWSY